MWHQKPPYDCFGQWQVVAVPCSLHRSCRVDCTHLKTFHQEVVKLKNTRLTGCGKHLPYMLIAAVSQTLEESLLFIGFTSHFLKSVCKLVSSIQSIDGCIILVETKSQQHSLCDDSTAKNHDQLFMETSALWCYSSFLAPASKYNWQEGIFTHYRVNGAMHRFSLVGRI